MSDWNYFSPMLHEDDDDLDVWQYRLLGHYRRVWGATGRICDETSDETAGSAHMSSGKVCKVRRELEALGRVKLIRVGNRIHVAPVERWEENRARYQSVHEVNDGAVDRAWGEQSVHGVNDTDGNVHQVNDNVHGVNDMLADSNVLKVLKQPENKELKDSDVPNGTSQTAKKPTPKAVGKKQAVPAAQMTAMKNAIAAAFGWKWPPKKGDPPATEPVMTREQIGKVQKAAQSLCLAAYRPEDIPAIYQFCVDNFDQFGPVALASNAGKGRPVAQSPPPSEQSSNGSKPPSSALDHIDLGTVRRRIEQHYRTRHG